MEGIAIKVEFLAYAFMCIVAVANADSLNPLLDYQATSCGRTINTNNRIIRLPVDDATLQYENNLECCWTINTPHANGVTFRFLTLFEMQTSFPCQYDYLELKASNGDSFIKLCNVWFPATLPADIVVADPYTSQNMQLCFHSDNSYVGRGFAVQVIFDPVDMPPQSLLEQTYPATACLTEITSDEIIRLPLQHGKYVNNMDCCWSIRSPGYTTKVNFEFLDVFSIEFHSHCDFDFLELINANGESVAKLCGPDLPADVEVHDDLDDMLLCFVSDPSVVRAGFAVQVSFTVADEPLATPAAPLGISNDAQNDLEQLYPATACKTSITNDAIIRLPLVGGLYENNQHCCWNIRASTSTTKLKFEFLTLFNIEHANNNCWFDYLELIDANGEVIRKLCGEYLPPDVEVSRATDNMLMCFHSDHSIEGGGFAVQVTFIEGSLEQMYPETACTTTVTDDRVIRMPLFNGKYVNNKDCCWNIQAPSDTIKVHFKFLVQFDIEFDPTCSYDYLKIKDATGVSIRKLCGTRLPPDIEVRTHPSSSMTLCFHSDHSVIGDGFAVEVSFVR